MAKSKKVKESARKHGGPFLAAAFVCDSFMDDASGKVSAIGISDGCNFYVTHDAPVDFPSKEQPAVIMLNILLLFRSGDSPGKHTIKLIIETPDGNRSKALEKEVTFSEPSHGGINLKTNANLSIYSAGVFWIDVFLDDKRYTRIPFNITFQRLPVPPQSKSKIAKTQVG
jgi:hypothetical protein